MLLIGLLMCGPVLPTKQNYTVSSFTSRLTANPGIITLLPDPFVKVCVGVCVRVHVGECKSNRPCRASVSRSRVLIRHPLLPPITTTTPYCTPRTPLSMHVHTHACNLQHTHMCYVLSFPHNKHAHAQTHIALVQWAKLEKGE